MKKIILIIICFLACGCYNYREINDLAIISALGIDYQDNNFILTLEIEKNEQDNELASYLIHGKGDTIASALQNASLSFDKDLYFINLDALIISSSVANTKLDQVLNYIAKDNNFAFDFNIALSDNIDKIFDIINQKEEIAGTYLSNIFRNTNNNLINMNFSSLLELYTSKYYNLILSVIEVNEDVITIDKAALFNNQEIAGYLNLNEISIYNILQNNLMDYYLKINYLNEELIFKAQSYSAKTSYKKDTINFDIDLLGTFMENPSINLNDELVLAECKKIVNQKFKDEITNFIKKILETNSDPLGFKKLIFNQTRNQNINLTNIKYKINSQVYPNYSFFSNKGDL